MIIFPKFVRHPSLAFGMKLADDGAGSQPERRRVCDESSAGPRPLFTVPPPVHARRRQSPPADFNAHTLVGTPREGRAFSSAASDTAGAQPSRVATPTAREGGAASLKFLQGAERGEADVREIDEVADWHPLDELAALIRSLTYGEMLALAAAIARVRGPIAQQQELPPALHLWATEGR